MQADVTLVSLKKSVSTDAERVKCQYVVRSALEISVHINDLKGYNNECLMQVIDHARAPYPQYIMLPLNSCNEKQLYLLFLVFPCGKILTANLLHTQTKCTQLIFQVDP